MKPQKISEREYEENLRKLNEELEEKTKKLKESKNQFRSLVETTSDWIWEVDQNAIYTYVSPKIKDLLGYEPEEIIGKTPFDLMPQDESLRISNFFQSISESQKPFTGLENINLHKDGRSIMLETSGVPFFGENGGFLGYRGIDRNITVRKRAEQKLKESEENLKKLNEELEQKVEERTKKLKKSEEKYRKAFDRAEFYKDLFTHDINNILQNILSAMELSDIYLDKPNNQKKIEELIKISRSQVIRGAKLVSNIRKFSQLEKEKTALKKIEVNNILKSSINSVKKPYIDRKINLQVDSIEENLYTQANDFLQDVFENILLNATKHNENPTVEIIVKISKEQKEGIKYIKIEFLDNGMGIEEERKSLIFIRGVKSVSGMGLGLSLVKRIIDSYDGKIWVEDRVRGDYSRGSNFIILIPEV